MTSYGGAERRQGLREAGWEPAELEAGLPAAWLEFIESKKPSVALLLGLYAAGSGPEDIRRMLALPRSTWFWRLARDSELRGCWDGLRALEKSLQPARRRARGPKTPKGAVSTSNRSSTVPDSGDELVDALDPRSAVDEVVHLALEHRLEDDPALPWWQAEGLASDPALWGSVTYASRRDAAAADNDLAVLEVRARLRSKKREEGTGTFLSDIGNRLRFGGHSGDQK